MAEAERELFIDDRCIIPEWIKKMTKEERQAMIAKLEKEAREEKQRILNRISQ